MNTLTHAPVQRAVRLLQQDPSSRTNLLAEQVGLSPTSLKRQFKKAFGISIDRCRRELRLHEACELLMHSELSVKEIRHKVGISDGANFVRAFRIRWQMTPSEFRKVHRKYHPRVQFD